MMNKEDIVRMAKEAGFVLYQFDNGTTPPDIRYERFAALVASAEREACAKLVDEFELPLVAEAIRAKGQA